MHVDREKEILKDIKSYCKQDYKTQDGRIYKKISTIVIIFFLLFFILSEPYTKQFLAYLNTINLGWPIMGAVFFLLYFLKGVVFLEVLGYLLHRFTEHPSIVSKISAYHRQNQRYHWVHHMVIYPFGENYIERKSESYMSVLRKGLPLYFLIPLAFSSLLTIAILGLTVEAFIVISAALLTAELNDVTHSRFHLLNHPWAKYKYFQWLADIHLLHHWDQEKNFTIWIPLLDMLFGTYISPAKQVNYIKKYLSDNEINASDLINWNHLLTEIYPVNDAVYISAVKDNPILLEKIKKIAIFLTQTSKIQGLAQNFLKNLEEKTRVFLLAVKK